MSGGRTFRRSGAFGGAILLLAVFPGCIRVIIDRSSDAPPPGQRTNLVAPGTFPACAQRFPRVPDAQPIHGFDDRQCVFTYTSKMAADDVFDFYESALPAGGYRFDRLASPGGGAGIALRLTHPECGSMAIRPASDGSQTTVIVAFGGPCPSDGG